VVPISDTGMDKKNVFPSEYARYLSLLFSPSRIILDQEFKSPVRYLHSSSGFAVIREWCPGSVFGRMNFLEILV